LSRVLTLIVAPHAAGAEDADDAEGGVVLLSKRDFSPFMMGLFA
jgi:hypothetical protein